MLRRFTRLVGSQVRNMDIQYHVTHVKYVIPLRDDVIGKFQYVIVKNDEIILSFKNPEEDDIKNINED